MDFTSHPIRMSKNSFAPSPWLVNFDGGFSISDASTQAPSDTDKKKTLKRDLEATVTQLDDLQRRLYADNRYAVLLVFQAMDAAGKDSTIRAVMRGVNPAGCQVFSFKQPSSRELDHDFLWRTAQRMPERGRIGVFNRSYYEEALVVRVHPEYLRGQRLPQLPTRRNGQLTEQFWKQRLESIAEHEKHLARNGTVILKFFLNVSREEQRQRFLSRIDEPEKNWKFSAADIAERGHWDKYMHAYDEALNATSQPWAPWYAVPADNKPYMRLTVARIVAEKLDQLGLRYPQLSREDQEQLQAMRAQLEAEQ